MRKKIIVVGGGIAGLMAACRSSIRALAAFKERRQRSDRVFFAGDYLVCPYTEAALTSGLRAADDVRTRSAGSDVSAATIGSASNRTG